MIRLHTLGVLDLRGPEGLELRSVLQQPKRLGLLAYLAIATPHRFHRRDTLLSLFWPELDQEHARAALRRSLYFLRAELGAEVVIGRGDDEVAVPKDALWCDATALELALDQGDAGEALALYRGPLLDGLYVAGASAEYQEWLDRERARLRERAAGAARSLVDRSEAEGRLTDAAGWAGRVLDLSPDDEGALRRLLGLLDRVGDRSAALKAYEQFVRRLAEEFELQPSPETVALVDLIRARVDPVASRARAPRSSGALDAPLPPGTIAVLPFSVRGESRFSYLGEGMVELLATKLHGPADIRTVDPRALLRFLGRDGATGVPDPRAVAEHFGADRYLMGGIVEAGGRIEASAELHSLDGRTLARVHAQAADEAGIFDLVDELARQLLVAQRGGSGARLARLAALTTDSFQGLKAYLTGEHHLRAGRYFDAMEAFQAALAADPSFALAYFRLAASAAGCALPDLAREYATRGIEYQGRLSAHDQLLFSAQRAWLSGAVSEAESLYNSITGTHPDDVETWFLLGDLLFHSNPLRGRSATEARGPFERVIRLDPDHVGAMVHLTRISALEGRKGETHDLIERILRVSPRGDQALAMRALRAFSGDDATAMTRVIEELQQARAITVAIAFSDVALYAGNLPGAERLARSFIQVARSPELRALCHILLAHLALSADNLELAWRELASAEGLDQTWGVEMRALFAAQPFVPQTERELDEIRRALERLGSSGPGSPSAFLIFAMHHGLHPALRLYLLGLLEVRLGDLAAAAGHLAELGGLPSESTGLAASLGLELGAAIARAEGRVQEALALLERPGPRLWFQLTVASPFFSLASQRFLRAELLYQLGRSEEAVGWYGSLAERSPYELIYAPAARRRLQEIAQQRSKGGLTPGPALR
jgi:serine/threonine-protein kinase